MHHMHKILYTLLAVSFLGLYASHIQAQNPRVLIKTDAGDITLELFEQQAPVTTANFMQYVKEKRYNGASFYRVLKPDNQPKDNVKIGVVQGGLAPNLANVFPPVAHETTQKTGLLHQDGTLSMVRQAPGTARSEFFICTGNQPELDFGGKRNKDGQGFAAFGKVVSGMETVRKIQRMPLKGQLLTTPVKIISATRL
jgi:peptidyl-prolyl cis-trans isomerase A (cyclophilin A)